MEEKMSAGLWDNMKSWSELVAIVKMLRNEAEVELNVRQKEILDALDEKVFPGCNPECLDFNQRGIPHDFDVRIMAYLTTNPAFSEQDRNLILKAVMNYGREADQPLEKLSVHVIKELRRELTAPYKGMEITVKDLNARLEDYLKQLENEENYTSTLMGEIAFLTRSLQGILQKSAGKVVSSETKVLDAFEKDLPSEEIINIIKQQNRKFIQYLKEESKKASLDGLTKIMNRGTFDHVFPKAINDCINLNEPISILLFDIDLFKGVNDTYGHQVGDEAIKYVVKRTKEMCQSNDILLARYGGEEFVAILKKFNIKEAVQLAEHIRSHVAEKNLAISDKNLSIAIKISVGAAQYTPEIASPNAFLEAADKALYEAKKTGRNKVCVTLPKDWQ